MAKINCSVDSCNYWDKGNVCQADSIMVKQNRAGQSNNYNMEIGSMGAMDAKTSTETQCETFRPKSHQNQSGGQSNQYDTEYGTIGTAESQNQARTPGKTSKSKSPSER